MVRGGRLAYQARGHHPGAIGDFLDRRDAALRAHRTQVEPDGFFFATPNDFLREVWPYDDYVLIDSKVETQIPEYDVFAGLR